MRPLGLIVVSAIAGAAVLAAAGAVVYLASGRIAAGTIVRSAERETERALSHVLAEAVARVADPASLSVELEQLAGPDGLPYAFGRISRNLNFVAAFLYAPDGTVVWSTEPRRDTPTSQSSSVVTVANTGGATPWLAPEPEFLDIGGVLRRFDAVSSYVPVRSSSDGPVIGILQGHRDITDDLAVQSAESRSAILRATAATMGGLFTALLGFAFVAARSSFRLNGRRRDSGADDRSPEAGETALDGVATVDAGGRVTAWSRRAEAILGWPADEALGRAFDDMFLPSEAVVRLRTAVAEHPAPGVAPPVVRRVDAGGRHRDGRLIPVELSAVAAETGAGRTCTVFLRDITHRREVEDSLRRAAFENAYLAEMGRRAGSSPDLHVVLQALAEGMRGLFAADRIAFGIVNRPGGAVTLEHVSGIEVPGLGVGAAMPFSGGLVEESARAGEPLVVDEAALEARGLRDRTVAAEMSAGVRSELVAPVFRGDDLVACLLLASCSRDAFTRRDLPLAEQVAQQAAGPVANAVLYASTRRETEEGNALAEMGRIAASALDEDAAFGPVFRRVKDLVNFDWIAVSTADPEGGTVRLAWGAGGDGAAWPRGGRVPLAGSVTEAVAGSRSGLVLGHVTPDAVGRRFPEAASLVGGRARSSVSAPLIVGGGVVGALHLMSAAPETYSLRDLALVERIGAHIAPAVRGAALQAGLRQQVREREVLADITRLAGSALEVDESLEVLAERLRELFSFDVFVINTVDPDRGVVRDRRVAGRGATGIDWGVDEPLEGTLTGRAVRERAAFIAQASSAEEIARLYPESREELEGGACSFLTVPLMFSDAVVGTLQLRALELDAFSEEDLARAERVAGHVAGAVASAGLRDALVQEAAEREALAEIGRIVTSTLDVNAVYDEFAGQVRRVVRFDRLGVYLAEAEGGALTVRYAAGVDIPGMRPGSALSLGAGALDELFPGKLGRIFGPGQSYPLAGARVETAGGPARELPSAMTVPLLSGDRVIGVLELRSAEPGAYSERHLALAERIAALIAGAISNAHLHSRIQRESHERAVLAEIGRIVGSSPDIGDVYERFAEQVRALIPFDGVAVSTLDAAGQMVAGAYLAGVDVGGMAPGHSSPAAETVAGRAALSGKARLERVRDPGASELGAARGDSQIVIPLVSEGRAVGALTLAARGRDLYTEREVALAQQVAVQIAGAVARSQLHGELRLRGTALEAAADMILVTDRDGTIEYVNEAFARQTGYTKEEAVGRNPRMLKSDRQDPAYYKHLWDTILAGEVWQGTLTNRRKDGSEYPEEMTITPVRGEDGEIARFIAIKRDITERVRAEEERETLRKLDTENRELQRVNEARSRFVSTVSHELRTPLTSLLAFADILARNVAGNLQSRQIEQIEAIRRSGQRLQMLINDLLDVSRIDSGTFRLEETRFDARELLDEVVRSFGPILADRRQALKTSVPDRPLLVYADRERLSQVVSNLLSNASKYSPDDSVIDLEVRTHGSRLSVLVRDYGIGISAEDQQKLFTPFFRADNEATRSVPGTGLGLVIARSIVELHGGRMSFESEWGAGTTFRFSLPRLLDEVEGVGPAPPP